ncbi:MAG: Plasmid stabilization protein [Candidatus Acidoferrum typicum]|jgi:plasmid stability protein|nr:Plasmid stabilization protein [Candidatus Acidoferrum typicum]
MEEEAREILRSALRASPAVTESLSDAIRKRFAAFGGLELTLPRRDLIREAPKFDE